MLRRLALILAGILIAALFAEAALRVVGGLPEVANPLYSFHTSDPVLGWRGKSDIRMRFNRPEFQTVVEHGPDGWRLPDPPPPAAPKRRVLFLGDSFTWGWGVAQGEVFTDRLQSRLAPDVAIVNRGVNAFGTSQEYLLMQRELAAGHYDAVALMFFQNDVGDNVNPKDGRRPIFSLDGDRLVPHNQPARPLSNPISRFFKDHSRAFQLVDFQLSLIGRALDSDEQEDRRVHDLTTEVDYHTLPGAAVTLRLLGEMNRLAQAHAARFFLVYLPQRSEQEHRPAQNPYMRAVHQLVEDAARQLDVPLIDLSDAFFDATVRGERVIYPTDEHWTPHGHQLAADVLLGSAIFK